MRLLSYAAKTTLSSLSDTRFYLIQALFFYLASFAVEYHVVPVKALFDIYLGLGFCLLSSYKLFNAILPEATSAIRDLDSLFRVFHSTESAAASTEIMEEENDETLLVVPVEPSGCGMVQIRIEAGTYDDHISVHIGHRRLPSKDLAEVGNKWSVLETKTQRPECIELNLRPPQSARPPPRIEVDHVSFGYSREFNLFENIQFTIEPGQRIAVVGEKYVAIAIRS